jgi:hypothetical protein
MNYKKGGKLLPPLLFWLVKLAPTLSVKIYPAGRIGIGCSMEGVLAVQGGLSRCYWRTLNF